MHLLNLSIYFNMKKIILVVIVVVAFNSAFSQTVTDNRTYVDTSSSLKRPDFEEMVIYRLQLKITTGKTNDAGSDDPVYVQMNNHNEKFYLARSIDNFQEGKTLVYDIIIDKIEKIKHIDFLRFGVTGEDGVCIKKVELCVNNCQSPIYVREFSWETGSCIDNNSSSLPSTLEIPGNLLRASSNWNYKDSRKDMWRPPLNITKTWLSNIVESTIGNQIMQEGQIVRWGSVGAVLENKTLFGPAVEVQKISDHVLQFDLDLEMDRVYSPNPELDVDFDLEFRCENGKIKTTVKNVEVNTDLVGTITNLMGDVVQKIIGRAVGAVTGNILGPGGAIVGGVAGNYIGGKFAAAINFDVGFDVDNPNISHSCKRARLDASGNLDLQKEN